MEEQYVVVTIAPTKVEGRDIIHVYGPPGTKEDAEKSAREIKKNGLEIHGAAAMRTVQIKVRKIIVDPPNEEEKE